MSGEVEALSQGYIVGFSLVGVFAAGMAGIAIWHKNFALAIGAGAAAGVHLLVLVYSSTPEAVVRQTEEEEKVEIMEMPQLEPEDELDVVDTEADEAPPEFAPPMIMDLPSTVPVSTMQIKFEPPPPEAPKSLGTITIPSNRTAPSSGWGKLFELKDLDQQPTAITRIAPQYPFEMKRAGQNGRVVVGFICDSTGTVRDAYIVDSTHREFEAAALQAIQKWKFRPGKKGGRAVNTKMQQPLDFKISN